MEQKSHQGQFTRIIRVLSKVEPHEIKATVASFCLVLILMAAYYILRPVRDAMASDWSDAEVSTLWTINFFFSFAVVAFYGLAASRISLKNLVPSVYLFFALSFIVFYFISGNFDNPILIDKAFYIWVSVFSLFPLSVFWSFMADLYNKEQSKRLFGIITTGASIGAMIGPSIPLLFSNLGTYKLMLIACTILLFTLPIIFYLEKFKANFHNDQNPKPGSSQTASLGGDWLAGFKIFFTNPFLIAIGLFLFLYTGIGSFIYFELKNLMAEFSRQQRTEYWAFIDLAINTLTIITGIFLTSRLTTRLGVGMTLALLPITIFVGLLSVAMMPLLPIVIGLQIFRRAGNYAITRPAREMLFTYVDQETRFKAKQVIDVVVYRGGDVFWGWAFTLLTAVVGLGMVGVALVGAAIAAVWTLVGLHLGKSVSRIKSDPELIIKKDTSYE